MKITFLTASLGSGGAERVVSLLANQMAEMGYQVEIICLKFDDVYYKTRDDVKVTIAIRECPGNLVKRLVWLRKHVKRSEAEVCVAFTEGVYCATIAAMLRTKIPVIASERLDPAAMSTNRKILKRFLLPYANWLVVQTQSIKDYFPKRIQKKTSIIYNPVNEEVFKSPDGLQVQGANTASSVQSSNTLMEGMGHEKLNRIISVGRLYPQKNQVMMIRAFVKVADKFPDWQLVIFGEGPLRAELEFLVSSFKLEGRVLLPGRTDHVIEELRKSEIFCLSSDYEGMSNAMIEAVCVGLPIVSTRVSGTEDLIREGNNGFVVERGDVEAMAEAFRKLMGDEELMERMGKNSRAMASMFRLDTITHKWMELINKVIDK